MSFANLADRLSPAVVNIATRQSVTVRQQQLPPGFEEFFRRFGGEAPNGGGGQDGAPVTQRGGSLGSPPAFSSMKFGVGSRHGSRRRRYRQTDEPAVRNTAGLFGLHL